LDIDKGEGVEVKIGGRRVSCLGVTLPAILGVVSLWMAGIAPSGTRVEVHPPQGEAAQIDCRFGIVFKVPEKDGTVLAFPVGHGPALLDVRFADGRVVWATFFNADVGARRKMDIYVSREPGTGRVEFRQVVNGKREVFHGSVDPAKTSKDKPFVLDYI